MPQIKTLVPDEKMFILEYNKNTVESLTECMREMKQKDAALIRAYLAGNRRAFDMLYARYERPLFAFLMRFAGNRGNAEDLFQQTWIKVIHGLDRYEERGTFSSWLFGIAYNCGIDFVRKEARGNINDFTGSGMDHLPGTSDSPEAILIDKEKQEWLHAAIQRLPAEQKEVVLLRLAGEVPFKEIAEILDCPLNTVLGRMHYAMKSLKKAAAHSAEESKNGVS